MITSDGCFNYGINHGCDENCPVLRDSDCKNVDENWDLICDDSDLFQIYAEKHYQNIHNFEKVKIEIEDD